MQGATIRGFMGLVLASATLCLAPGVSSAVDAVSNLGTRLAVQLRDDSGSSVQVTTLGLTYTIVQRLGIEHYGELARTDEARLAKQLGTLRILTPRGQETTLARLGGKAPAELARLLVAGASRQPKDLCICQSSLDSVIKGRVVKSKPKS